MNDYHLTIVFKHNYYQLYNICRRVYHRLVITCKDGHRNFGSDSILKCQCRVQLTIINMYKHISIIIPCDVINSFAYLQLTMFFFYSLQSPPQKSNKCQPSVSEQQTIENRLEGGERLSDSALCCSHRFDIFFLQSLCAFVGST